MDAFFFGQVKRNDWSWASRWSCHTVGGVADVSYPAGLDHSSEGSCDFMALLVHTYISANAPVSGNRWDTQTLTLGIHMHVHTKHTHTHTHTHTQSQAHSAVQSGCPNKLVKGSLMSPIEELNRKSLCYIRVQHWQEIQLLVSRPTATAQTPPTGLEPHGLNLRKLNAIRGHRNTCTQSSPTIKPNPLFHREPN